MILRPGQRTSYDDPSMEKVGGTMRRILTRFTTTIATTVKVCAISGLCGFSSLAVAVPADVIEGIQEDIVDRICSDGGEWLTCYSKSPGQCKDIA
jgi:hypothetical protein